LAHKELLLDAITLGFVVGNRSFDLVAVGVVVGQCGMHLGQVDVPEAVTDLLGRQAEFVPANDTLNRDASAGDARTTTANVSGGDDQSADVCELLRGLKYCHRWFSIDGRDQKAASMASPVARRLSDQVL
jgi:hypothetical protein